MMKELQYVIHTHIHTLALLSFATAHVQLRLLRASLERCQTAQAKVAPQRAPIVPQRPTAVTGTKPPAGVRGRQKKLCHVISLSRRA